jgi:hypothetical protein
MLDTSPMNPVVCIHEDFSGRVQTAEAYQYPNGSFDCGSRMCCKSAWRPG